MAILGVIADDFTGATDIAGMLVKGGMRTIQTIGVPAKAAVPDDVDAVGVALKTPSIAAKDAIAQSLAALKALPAASLRAALDKLLGDGVRHAIVDAVADTDLGIIGEAIGDDALVTGGSGVALGLPAAYRRRGLLAHKSGADALPKVGGAAAVLAGSCSAATLGQIAAFKGAHLALDTDAICRGEPVGDKALAWAKDKLGNGPILLSASDTPEAVKALQAKYGVEKSSQAIEKTMAALAKGLLRARLGPPVAPGA